jgi:hypothetical protein
MAAFTTFHPRKAIVQDTAVEIAVDHMPHRRTEKTVLFDKTVVIDLLQFFKMILNTLIILGLLRFSGLVNGGCSGHLVILLKQENEIPDKIL